MTLAQIDELYAAGNIDSDTDVAMRKALVKGVLIDEGEHDPRNTEVNARRICAFPRTREQARQNIERRRRAARVPWWFGPFTFPKWLARLTGPQV